MNYLLPGGDTMTLIKKGSIEKKLLVLIVGAVSLPIIFTLGLLFWQQARLANGAGSVRRVRGQAKGRGG